MNDLQCCVFCSFILSLILLFNCWKHIVISCVMGRIQLNFNLSISLMRSPISVVKLRLQCFLLPCGMCALYALVRMELKCAIVVSMLVF